MNRLILVTACALVGCSNKPRNNPPAPTPDAGVDAATPDADGLADVAVPPGRALERSVPLSTTAGNLLEDPLLTLEIDAWYAVAGSDAEHNLHRRFETHAPLDAAIAVIPPAGGRSVCALGRMLWGGGFHRGSVWVDRGAADEDAVTVSLIGVQIGSDPVWTRFALAPTGETHDGNGRAWREWGGTSPERFGWGYFEVCHNATTAVAFVAPALVEVDAVNARVVAVESEPASDEVRGRIGLFEQWRERRRAR